MTELKVIPAFIGVSLLMGIISVASGGYYCMNGECFYVGEFYSESWMDIIEKNRGDGFVIDMYLHYDEEYYAMANGTLSLTVINYDDEAVLEREYKVTVDEFNEDNFLDRMGYVTPRIPFSDLSDYNADSMETQYWKVIAEFTDESGDYTFMDRSAFSTL